jgi:hypothetical protein
VNRINFAFNSTANLPGVQNYRAVTGLPANSFLSSGKESTAMPSYNNAARNYLSYPDYEEEYEAPAPPRHTGGNLTSAYRIPGNRTTSSRIQATMPQPMPGSLPRFSSLPNLPAPSIVPRGGVHAPPASRPAPRQTTNRRPAAQPVQSNLSGSSFKLGFLAVAVLTVLVLSYLVVSFAVHTWQTWQDDMTYGRPRITRLEANVGHNEANGVKTLFTAQNLNGQISITEFPGSDPSKTRVIVGPQLFGKDKELIPIKLQTKDVNGDGAADLIATADDQVLIYINENGNFRPINDQERNKLTTQGSEGTR